MKDHEIRNFVDRLLFIANTFKDAQQLRERISHEVVSTIRRHERQMNEIT